MKKLLLVVFVGMVLAMDMYGIIEDFKANEIKEVDHIKETTATVYME